MVKNKKRNFLIKAIIFVYAFVVFLVPFTFVSNGAENISPKESLDKIFLISFETRQEQTLGNRILAHFYIPSEYKVATYEYGIIIFPEMFIETYSLDNNYFQRASEVGGISYLTYPFEEYSYIGGVRLFSDMNRIPESRFDLSLCYVVYVKDENSVYEYSDIYYTSYNTIEKSNLSDEELKALFYEKKKDSNFERIVLKLNEFVDSVWIYIVIGLSSVVVVWGAYIGIKIIVSKKKEESVDAKGMERIFLSELSSYSSFQCRFLCL